LITYLLEKIFYALEQEKNGISQYLGACMQNILTLCKDKQENISFVFISLTHLFLLLQYLFWWEVAISKIIQSMLTGRCGG
jgi:hypothetical protein